MMCGSMELSAAISHCVARARAPRSLGSSAWQRSSMWSTIALGFERDVTLKMKEVSPVIFCLLPCYVEIGPCYFFRGISLETLMELAFVDDIVVILTHFCGSPLYFALLFSNEDWGFCFANFSPAMAGGVLDNV